MENNKNEEKKKDDGIITVLGYKSNFPLLNERFKKENEGLYCFLLASCIFDEFKDKGMGVKRINKGLKKGTNITYENLYVNPRKKIEILRNTFEIMKELFSRSFELGTIERNPMEDSDIDKAVEEWSRLIPEKIEKLKKTK